MNLLTGWYGWWKPLKIIRASFCGRPGNESAHGRNHLRIDYKVSGIGSNSSGPELKEQYRLCEKDIDFSFTVMPLE